MWRGRGLGSSDPCEALPSATRQLRSIYSRISTLIISGRRQPGLGRNAHHVPCPAADTALTLPSVASSSRAGLSAGRAESWSVAGRRPGEPYTRAPLLSPTAGPDPGHGPRTERMKMNIILERKLSRVKIPNTNCGPSTMVAQKSPLEYCRYTRRRGMPNKRRLQRTRIIFREGCR